MHPHLISFIKAPVGYTLNALASLAMLAEPAPVVGRAAVVVGGWLVRPCDLLCLRDGVQDEPMFVGRGDVVVDGALEWPVLDAVGVEAAHVPGPVADSILAVDGAGDVYVDWDEMDRQIQEFLDEPLPVVSYTQVRRAVPS